MEDECFCGHSSANHFDTGCQACAEYGPGTCEKFEQDDGQTVNTRTIDRWGIGLRKRTWWERLIGR